MSVLLISHINTTQMLDFAESNWLLLLFFALGFILPRIPVVGKFFNVINTALHEFGHALMALITGGSVDKIELFNDTSGTTTTKSNSKFGAFLVSLAGYPFAASVAWLAFYLIGQGAEKGLVIGLTVLFVLMLLFWIRNWYGVVWVVLFSAVNGVLLYMATPPICTMPPSSTRRSSWPSRYPPPSRLWCWPCATATRPATPPIWPS